MKCTSKQRNLRVFVLLWLCLFLGMLCATVCTAEETYRITEQELTRLETNLTTLKNNNKKQQNELQNLLIQLNESKTLQQQTATSLENANKYLVEYAKEVKAKERRIKMQRTFGYTLATLFLGALIKEKNN